eukprot:612312-Amphidinium_carterae.1
MAPPLHPPLYQGVLRQATLLPQMWVPSSKFSQGVLMEVSYRCHFNDACYTSSFCCSTLPI